MNPSGKWRIFLVLALGWGLLIAVLYALQLPKAWLLRCYSEGSFFLWQAVGFVLTAGLTSIFRPHNAARFAALYLLGSTLLLLYLPGGSLAAELLLFVSWALAATATARLVLRRLLGPNWATWGTSACLLYSVLIPVSFFLGLFEVLSKPMVSVVATAMALPGLISFARSWRASGRSALAWLDQLNPIGIFALGATAISFALALAWAATPENESDSIRMHLPYIQQVTRGGGFEAQAEAVGFQRRMVYGVRALHATGYVVGGFTTAKFMSWFPLLALFFVTSEEICRRCRSFNFGVLAAAFVVTCPIFPWLSRTLYHDHIIALFCVTAFITLFRAFDEDTRGLFLSAFIMGCAVQTKYNVLIFAVVWALCLLVLAFKNLGPRRGLRVAATTLLILGVTSSPWYLYTFFETGNPFFPYFETYFDSPLWPDDMSTRFNHHRYRFDDMLWGTLLLPWALTFKSEQITQGFVGSVGYPMLAFLPFLVIYATRRHRNSLELGLVGLLCLLGIWVRSSYTRYWLPVYPLLLMPWFLSFAETLWLTRWRLSRLGANLTGAVVFLLLLIPLPFWAHGLPWNVYVNETTPAAWLDQRFPGYSGVTRLNELSEPEDRVLVTGYLAIHTVDAEAYDFPFWHSPIHGIHNAAAIEKFLEDHRIDYWIVDHSARDSAWFADKLDLFASYWADSRIVSASGSVVGYRMASASDSPGFVAGRMLTIEPLLAPRPDPALDAAGWHDPHAGTPLAASAAREPLGIPVRGSLSHLFSRPADSPFCKVTLDLRGDPNSGSLVSLEWLGDHQNRIAVTTSRIKFGRGKTLVFSQAPPGARRGRLLIRSLHGKTLKLGTVLLELGTLSELPDEQPADATPRLGR